MATGSRSLRGSAVYKVTLQGGKTRRLDELDNPIIVFEYEIEPNGTYRGKSWQWK
jgi:hypothetical protein